MRYAEKWGDSIDAAVALALADLKLTRDEVTVTVLEEPSRGFFGIGSKLAKVRVEEIEKPAPPKEEKSEEKAEEPKKPRVIYTDEMFPAKEGDEEGERTARPPRQNQKRSRNRKDRSENRGERKSVEEKGEGKREERPARPARGAESYAAEERAVLIERPSDLSEVAEHPVKSFLSDVFEKMGLQVNIRVSTNKESVYVDVDGPDSGTVIGKRGQTLDALQYLASLVANKEESSYIRVVIDAEGYREKREKTLERLANKLADKAVRTGRTVRLEPMNPYERKVIHTALQKRPEVTTRSEGEEPFRRVVIEVVK